MRALGIVLLLTFVASLESAEEQPLQDPQLRIEAATHTATINRIDIYEVASEISKRVAKLTEGRQVPVMANYGPLFTLASLQ